MSYYNLNYNSPIVKIRFKRQLRFRLLGYKKEHMERLLFDLV